MTSDFTWKRSAEAYVDMFAEAIGLGVRPFNPKLIDLSRFSSATTS